ncbi:MAG: hypothetical protein QOE35_2980 [Actinomycetota bacterium]|jgi:hypothetical protein
MSDPASPEAPPSPWAGVSIGAGLALAAIAALSILGVIAQGFAVEQQNTGVVYKLGIAFLRNLDATPAGLMAVVAVALVAAPAIAGVPAAGRQNRQAAVAFVLVLLTCLIVIFGSVLGVVTRLHFDQGPGQQITSATRRVLATFVVRAMGPALVALGAAVALLPARFPRPVTAPPYADAGDDAPDGGPAAGPA